MTLKPLPFWTIWIPGLILIGFLIVHPGFQVIDTNSWQMAVIKDDGQYHIIGPKSSYWKFWIPFVMQPADYYLDSVYRSIYNMTGSATSKDGYVMDFAVDVRNEYTGDYKGTLMMAKKWGLNWLEKYANLKYWKDVKHYAENSNSEDLFRNGYLPADGMAVGTFRYQNKYKESEVRATNDLRASMQFGLPLYDGNDPCTAEQYWQNQYDYYVNDYYHLNDDIDNGDDRKYITAEDKAKYDSFYNVERYPESDYVVYVSQEEVDADMLRILAEREIEN